MITGFRIDVSSDEVKEHALKRASYHEERASFYAGQVRSLRDGGARPANVTNDPISSLEASAVRHQSKAEYFKFMAAHIIPDETYRLEESDLGRLEFVAGYGF
jgi:hypothetical protein